MTTPRAWVPVLAVVLVLLQHDLYVSGVSGMINFPQNVWLIVNTVEVVVLLAASRMLIMKNKTMAMVIGIIGVCLLVAVIVEDFTAFDLGDYFWLPMSTVIILGLILSAVYVTKYRRT